MSFHASPYRHMLDKRLQDARIELLNDTRIHRALRLEAEEAEHFIHQLVEEKLAAAAQNGFEAVAASVRVEAGNALIAAGVPSESQRSVLDDAGAYLEHPKLIADMHDAIRIGPAAAGVIAGAIGLCLVTAWYLSVGFHWALFAVLVVAGLCAGAGTYRFVARMGAQQKEKIARELPAAICRLYQQELKNAVSAYEGQINTALDQPREAVV